MVSLRLVIGLKKTAFLGLISFPMNISRLVLGDLPGDDSKQKDRKDVRGTTNSLPDIRDRKFSEGEPNHK